MKDLSRLIGVPIPVHSVLRAQPGRMATAVAFFTEMLKNGWSEDQSMKTVGDWGKARFVVFKSSDVEFRFQITEPNQLDPVAVDDVHHVAMKVDHPDVAAREIVNYFNSHLDSESPEATMEILPGRKVWLEIPAVFATPIEFVPK